MSPKNSHSAEAAASPPKDLKQLVQGRGRSEVMAQPEDIEAMMQSASTTLVDPGVALGDFVDGKRRQSGKLLKSNKPVAGAAPTKMFHSYMDAEVGFLLKETAARRRMSPRALLEEIIRAACT